MKKALQHILIDLEFAGFKDFLHSLFPSVKFDASIYLIVFGLVSAIAENIFGLSFLAMCGLFAMFVIELATGLLAAKKRNEKITSKRLSRFSVKVFVYLSLISIPYLFQVSYESRGSTVVSAVFEWMHVFLIMQIFQEHIVSILENLATIQGKDKTYWIEAIKAKFKISKP